MSVVIKHKQARKWVSAAAQKVFDLSQEIRDAELRLYRLEFQFETLLSQTTLLRDEIDMARNRLNERLTARNLAMRTINGGDDFEFHEVYGAPEYPLGDKKKENEGESQRSGGSTGVGVSEHRSEVGFKVR